jgi:hypothetical protein
LPEVHHLGQQLALKPVDLVCDGGSGIFKWKDPETGEPKFLELFAVCVDPAQERERNREDVLQNPAPKITAPEPPLTGDETLCRFTDPLTGVTRTLRHVLGKVCPN